MAATAEKKGSARPVIAGGRTLAKCLRGNKSGSGGKTRKKRSIWGESGGFTFSILEASRTDRRGAAGRNVRSRRLPCGHTVLMLKEQRPTIGTCPKCGKNYDFVTVGQ